MSHKPIVINISIFKLKRFIIFYLCFVVFVLSAPVTFVVYRTTLLVRRVSVSEQLFDFFTLYVRNSSLLLHWSFRVRGLLHLRSSSDDVFSCSMNLICSYFIFLSPKLTNFVLKHKMCLLISSEIHIKAAKTICIRQIKL